MRILFLTELLEKSGGRNAQKGEGREDCRGW